MKIQNTILTAVTALTLMVGLAGCGGGNSNIDNTSDFEGSTQEQVQPDTFITRYDKTTGHIVEIRNDTTSEVLYADPALESLDAKQFVATRLSNDPFENINLGTAPPEQVSIATDNAIRTSVRTLTLINGKAYPTESVATSILHFETVDDVVQYYNANISKPAVADGDILSLGTVSNAVRNHARQVVDAAAKQVVSFSLNGEKEIREATNVASDYANGVPAWQAYLNMLTDNVARSYPNDTPPPVQSPQNQTPSDQSVNNTVPSEPAHLYLFACATYGVEVTDPEGTLAQMNVLLDDHIEVFEFYGSTKSVLTETDVPCEVIEFRG